MNIYHKKRPDSKVYRKIYESHFGGIPKDEYGRSYEIHHIDGDFNNNNPSNLIAVSIQEHYDIHYAQGDFLACRFIAGKLNKTVEEINLLKSLAANKRVVNGTHNLLRRGDGTSVSKDRVIRGDHPFLTREDGSNLSMDRVINGTNPFSKKGSSHPKYKDTIYKFINKNTGEVINSTFYDFRIKFNFYPGSVRRIILDPNQSLYGWRVVSA